MSPAKKKHSKPSAGDSKAVDQWFVKKGHPQTDLMQAVRKEILSADPRMAEVVKWSTPTFIYEGNLASIQPGAKKFVSLMFHNGAEIPGKHPHLEGDSRLVRTMKFADAAELKNKKAGLKKVVKAWCDWKDSVH